MQVSTVTDRAGLEALADEWRDLAESCVTSTVFQTYEWNAAWWRHFGGGKRLPANARQAANLYFFLEGEAFRGRRPHQIRLQGGDASSDSYCYPPD